MTTLHFRVCSVASLCLVAGAFLLSQTPPPQGGTGTPPPQAPPAGRGGLDAQMAMGADFSPKPPVVRLSPDEEQKRFLLPPGYRIEPVLTDPLIEDPVGVTFDGNGRMYVLEMRSYMQDADGSNSRAPSQPDLAPRGHGWRRQVRPAHGLRRQDGDAAGWRSRSRTA